MVSIPLHPGRGQRQAGDRRLQRLYRELKQAATFVARRKGAVLFQQGMHSRAAYLLARGQARLWMRSDRGEALTFHLVSGPCILGLPATMSRKGYNFTAALTTDAQVARLTRKSILKVLQQHQNLALCVVEILGRGVAEMSAHPKRAARKTA